MTGPRDVDLGRLAAAYGHRAGGAADERATAAAAAARLGPGRLAVDIGGGTGSHAAVFAAIGARVLVVDRSFDMVRLARDAVGAAVVGDAGSLPLGDECADLVYFHLSLHHGPAAEWIGEAARVVRPGGVVWVWTLAQLDESFLARWFPAVGVIDRLRFISPSEISAVMTAAGLTGVGRAAADETVIRSAGSWMAAVRAGFVSTLHLLPAEQIAAGLDAFAAAHPDPDEPVSYRLAFRRVSAIRPSLPS